eukprot:TRINITY_DN6411_c0_g1_i1.p1 TRINITY_DN6411_c0_g1~~TRINITY_DN6411_c0_g1_i1.p1  ORF type:complete len:358 (+),score=51.51 TRINITY_DN6411_c0_g1_i1:46-1119(+)
MEEDEYTPDEDYTDFEFEDILDNEADDDEYSFDEDEGDEMLDEDEYTDEEERNNTFHFAMDLEPFPLNESQKILQQYYPNQPKAVTSLVDTFDSNLELIPHFSSCSPTFAKLPPLPINYHVTVNVLPNVLEKPNLADDELYKTYNKIYAFDEQELLRTWLIAQNKKLEVENKYLESLVYPGILGISLSRLEKFQETLKTNLYLSKYTYWSLFLPLFGTSLWIAHKRKIPRLFSPVTMLRLSVLPLLTWHLGLSLRMTYNKNYKIHVDDSLRLVGFISGFGAVLHYLVGVRGTYAVPLTTMCVGMLYDQFQPLVTTSKSFFYERTKFLDNFQKTYQTRIIPALQRFYKLVRENIIFWK